MGSQSSTALRRQKDRPSLTRQLSRNSVSSANASSSSSSPQAKTSLAKKKRKKAFLIANRYVLGEQLGQGASALVRVATDNANGAIRAVKILDVRLNDRFGKRGAVDHEALKTIARGEGIWKRIGKHANCVELLDSVLHKGCYYMVMERYEASLKDKLSVVHRETEVAIAHLFRDMLSGIRRVHEVGVVHRDVKPSNFLVKYSDEHTKHWSVKLCDFGHATYIPTEGGLYNPGGTTPYMSPEMLDNRGYTEKTDIWSFGVTAYLMACREFPYWPAEASPKEADIKQAIIDARPRPRFVRAALEGDREDRVRKPLSSELIGFLQTMLQRSCALRCSSDEALGHSFLARKSRPVTAPASSSAQMLQNEDLKLEWNIYNSAPAIVDAHILIDQAQNPKVQHERDFMAYDSAPGLGTGPTGSWSTRNEELRHELPNPDPPSPISSHTVPRSISRSSDRSSARSSSSNKSSQRNGGDSQTASHFDSLRLGSVGTCVSTDASPRSLGSLSEEVYQRPRGTLTSGDRSATSSHQAIAFFTI